MEDLLAIPDFLKRKKPTKAELARAMKVMRQRRQIRMPKARTNPRHAIREDQRKEIS